MNDFFVSRIGGTMSGDIAVPEHEREVRFYSRVLTTGESPLWRDDLMNNIGMPIIGLGARTEELSVLPLQWMPHIQVADVGASAASAVALGGKELMHGKDENGKSQWAVMLDPSDAAFGLIPVVGPESLPSAEDASSKKLGCISWLDLTVKNAAVIRDFYCKVVGWSVEDVAMKDGEEDYADFNMLGGDGRAAAGICHARGVNVDLPSVWTLYLPVGDLAESLRRVEEEGGKIIKATRGSNGEYSFAAIQDPVGAFIALMAG